MIKYIKMSNTELMIGNVVNRSDYKNTIKNPMLLIIDRRSNDGSYYIGEYMPMMKDDIITLSYKDIVTVVDADSVLTGQYNDMFNVKDGIDKKSTQHKYH